jgi:hypothetical protein
MITIILVGIAGFMAGLILPGLVTKKKESPVKVTDAEVKKESDKSE